MFPELKEAARGVISRKASRALLRGLLRGTWVPSRVRALVHRKVAKRVRFAPGESFTYRTPGGANLRLLHQGTANYLYWLDEYESGTTRLFYALASQSRTVFDIGASTGLYSLLAATANPQAEVFAFEPLESIAAVFRANLALNPSLKRVQLFTCALCDRSGREDFYVAGDAGGTSSLNPAFRAGSRPRTVEVRRVDDFVREHALPKIDLVKLDTESTEPDVLRGFGERLAADRPEILCEVLAGRTERALEAILEPLGYRYLWIGPRGPIPRPHIAADPTFQHVNYWFTPRDPKASAWGSSVDPTATL